MREMGGPFPSISFGQQADRGSRADPHQRVRPEEESGEFFGHGIESTPPEEELSFQVL